MRELRPRIVRDLKLLPSITGGQQGHGTRHLGRREVTILYVYVQPPPSLPPPSPSPARDAREILRRVGSDRVLPSSSISISADSVGLCVRMGHVL